MYTTVTNHSFIDAFLGSNTYKDNFSYAGLNTLYDMLTEYEEATGEEMQLDIVAICWYYSEDSLENILKDYDLESIDELWDNTIYREIDGTDRVIYESF